MKKSFFIICVLITGLFLALNIALAADDGYIDEWDKHLDVYNGDGLDKPVNAVEYNKIIKKLDELKDKSAKKLKKGEMPPASTVNEPIKLERNDIIKTTTPLYYDGKTVPVGFYKISVEEVNKEYFLCLKQGKSIIIRVKANKVPASTFARDKVNYISTEIYQDKYFKINYKTLEYALTGYLAILN